MSRYGAVESAVRADLRQLAAENVGVQRSLAQTAYALAAGLDRARGLGTASALIGAAGAAKELRATLEALVGVGSDSDRTAEILAQLSSPLGDAEEPGS